MYKYSIYVTLILVLIASCDCKDMHFRRLPEEKEITFIGEVKSPPKAIYREGQGRDINLHLSSSDKEAQFEIIDWRVTNEKKGTLDVSQVHLGNNTLHYTPKEPGTHELEIRIALKGAEEHPKKFRYSIEVPLADWQVEGETDNRGNLTITITHAPELHTAAWSIQEVHWSEGLKGDIGSIPIRLNYGTNNLRLTLKHAVLKDPSVHLTLQGPDQETRTCQLDLTALCVAQLEGSMSEEGRSLMKQSFKVEEYRKETDTTYQLPKETRTDPRVNREKQAEVATLLGQITAFQKQYEKDLEAFKSNLETLEQAEVDDCLPVLENKNTNLKDAIASLKSAQVQLEQRCNTAHEALCKAIENNNQQAIETLLNDSTRLDINGEDQERNTALHWAVNQNNTELVKKILDWGGNEHIKGKEIMFSFSEDSKDNVDIACLLLDSVADLNFLDKYFLEDLLKRKNPDLLERYEDLFKDLNPPSFSSKNKADNEVMRPSALSPGLLFDTTQDPPTKKDSDIEYYTDDEDYDRDQW